MTIKVNKKAWGAALGLLLVGWIAYYGYQNLTTNNTSYIFDKNAPIKLNDVVNLHKKIDPLEFSTPTQTAVTASSHATQDALTRQTERRRPSMSGSIPDHILNSRTMGFFKYLQSLFKSSNDVKDHFQQVEAYLQENFNPDDAHQLFVLYQSYFQCEVDLAQDIQTWSKPNDTASYLEMLAKIQNFRRDRLGGDVADQLFGADIKAKEYAARRSAIVLAQDMYAQDKLRQIQGLNEDMWGDESGEVDQYSNDYSRYQERLEIYKKDLKELYSDGQKQRLLSEIRQTYFQPQVVKKLEAVDTMLAKESAQEKNYRESEAEIQNDTDLSATQKTERIHSLQKEFLGNKAEMFRRRENIRLARAQGKE